MEVIDKREYRKRKLHNHLLENEYVDKLTEELNQASKKASILEKQYLEDFGDLPNQYFKIRHRTFFENGDKLHELRTRIVAWNRIIALLENNKNNIEDLVSE